MKILSIGNSFSEDAHAYLHDAAESLGFDVHCTNLYIGGCSLEAHAKNLAENSRAYTPEYNGEAAETKISIPDALEGEEYDVITLQQASHFSGRYDTYFPYLRELYDYCRRKQQGAKIMLHETWAYEHDSTHPAFVNYGSSQKEMYSSLHSAYKKAAEQLGVEIIPVGSCIQYFRDNLREFDSKNGGMSLNRDGFHLSIPIGRLLAAYVWIEKLFRCDVRNSAYVPVGETRIELLNTIRENVHIYMSDL